MATFAATVFLKVFKKSVDKVDELNTCDSFDLFMNYIYHERSNVTSGFLPDMTQASLTEGNAKYKGEEVNVARLISLYNEFCQKVLKAKLSENFNHAIGYSSDAYTKFVKSADADIRMRVDEIARKPVS